MALPHYKLHPASEAPASFPVLLAPTEASSRLATLKQILCSRQLLLSLEILSFAAGAVLLWLLLDPTIKTPKPMHLLIPGFTLGGCLLLIVFIAFIKHRAEPELPDEADQPLALAAMPISKVKPPLLRTALITEMNMEAWSSEPFQEIMDEAVIAEVFNDDLVAPDHMIFSVKVAE